MSHKPQGKGSLCLNNTREPGCLHPPRSHENCLDSRSQRPGSGTHALFDSGTMGTIPAVHTAPWETADTENPDGKSWESCPFKLTFESLHVLILGYSQNRTGLTFPPYLMASFLPFHVMLLYTRANINVSSELALRVSYVKWRNTDSILPLEYSFHSDGR